ncbi:MAG: CoA pyrophosphatase [Spongiibacteraceae bacterium]
MIESLDEAREQLRDFRPARKWWRAFARRSAVALPLRDGAEGLEVLMIERAHREGDRWSGHMAFPGGMVDARDASSLAGAMRETREEVGIDLQTQGAILTRLSDIGSRSHAGHRRPLVISPYVFALTQEPTLRLNYEVADTEWVPLRFLADHGNRDVMDWEYKKMKMRLPFYVYRGRRIWGLSLRMLDELLPALIP